MFVFVLLACLATDGSVDERPLLKRLFAHLAPCFLVAFIATTTAGCLPRRLMVDPIADLVSAGLGAWESDADLGLVEKALPAHIKLAETLLQTDPANQRLLLLLSRLYGAYALIFAQTRVEAGNLKAVLPSALMGTEAGADWQAAASRYFDRGAGFALDAIQGLARTETAAAFFRSLGPADVPALFWYGFNLGGVIHHNRDNVAALARLYLVKGAMERVIALAPDHNHGLAHLVMMVVWGALPPALGGQPLKAEDHYRQALAISGGRLALADVYYARYVLQPLQQRQAFTDTLDTVARDWDKDPGLRLYNRLAQVRADLYLQAIDRLFEEE